MPRAAGSARGSRHGKRAEHVLASEDALSLPRKRQLDLDSAAIHGMCAPTKPLAATMDTNSPMTRRRKKQLELDATAMRKASKVAAKPKSMKKTTRKLEVKKVEK
ncbi:hypothetical protein ZWY2020_008548 [Hordeum vulgare]|nr:hypothetical protein ZWY2020_008548 [Hordeum vulgare]